MSYAKPDAIVMHPGSPDRRIEVSSTVVDSSQCILDDQITNGVAIRMALLYLLAMGRKQ
jgi:aspartate carbamoyltransferase catalytic subunit